MTHSVLYLEQQATTRTTTTNDDDNTSTTDYHTKHTSTLMRPT